MRKFRRWSLIFSKKFPLVQRKSLKSIKKLSMRDTCSFSVILVGPRICGVSHFAARKSRNSVTSLLLSNLSKLILKSPVSIIFLFSPCFRCLKITPIRMLSFIGLITSNQSTSNSLCVFLKFKLRSSITYCVLGIVSFK